MGDPVNFEALFKQADQIKAITDLMFDVQIRAIVQCLRDLGVDETKYRQYVGDYYREAVVMSRVRKEQMDAEREKREFNAEEAKKNAEAEFDKILEQARNKIKENHPANNDVKK